jgi:hypothetical protein
MTDSIQNPDKSAVESQVLSWLDNVVIGLNLCPFAAKPSRQNQIHIDVYEGSEAELMKHLVTAMTELDHYGPDTRETTLIVLSNCLQSFDDYNQFLGDVDWVIERGDWLGVYQVASFHPNYQFEGTHSQDAENLTNRSPFPILHLIREESLEDALEKYPNPELIPTDNIKRMESLTELQRLQLFPYLGHK